MPSTMFSRCAMLSLPLVLIACVQPALPPESPQPSETACVANELQYLVGQPAARLETMRFAGPLRIIRPDMAVTMDYSPSRLNIYVDGSEMIAAVRCG